MKNRMVVLLFIGLLTAFTCMGVDKLAIAEPVVRAGMEKDEGLMLWGILEDEVAAKAQGKYELISRAALQQMMTEIGLTTSSDLVNLNSTQKARLGQLETVKYLLISEIGKFGTKVNCTMRIMDASTGIIDPKRTVNLRCSNLDDLGDKLEAAVISLLSDQKTLDRSAVLKPIITAANPPDYLANEFSTIFESCMLSSGQSLQNLQSVDKILAQNGFVGALNELEPKQYVQIGKLLEVKNLMRATIDRFEILATPFFIQETGAQGTIYTGAMSGNLRVINTADGETLVVQPFDARIDFRQLPFTMTQTWTPVDYGKYMIRASLSEQILPELFKSLAAKQKK
ncbi:MAG: hypothetical protein IKR81_00940 [Victivallales bacterium]|nr:hypothetical protein [Victivallales bacterium]